jgi:hypothetical protein
VGAHVTQSSLWMIFNPISSAFGATRTSLHQSSLLPNVNNHRRRARLFDLDAHRVYQMPPIAMIGRAKYGVSSGSKVLAPYQRLDGNIHPSTCQISHPPPFRAGTGSWTLMIRPVPCYLTCVLGFTPVWACDTISHLRNTF